MWAFIKGRLSKGKRNLPTFFAQNFLTVAMQLWKLAKSVSLSSRVWIICIWIFAWHILAIQDKAGYSISLNISFLINIKDKKTKVKNLDSTEYHQQYFEDYLLYTHTICRISYVFVDICYMSVNRFSEYPETLFGPVTFQRDKLEVFI